MSDPKYLRKGFEFCPSHLIEECGEVLAAAGKTQRWGRFSCDPTKPTEEQETNQDWLERELQDLKGSIARLEAEIEEWRRLPRYPRDPSDEDDDGR